MKYAIDSLCVILIFTLAIYFMDRNFLSSKAYLLAVLLSLLVAFSLNLGRYIFCKYGNNIRRYFKGK